MVSLSAAPTRQKHATQFRPDIEGMRAVAIGLVLLYHAGLPWVPGGFVGVDIFFVISGFLITSLLLREVERTGRVSLPTFYARRAKRLLPATAVVLVATAVLTYVFLPVTDRRVFGWDIASAAAYVANWRFADRSVDYLAEGIGASPVQHFWSLAVEEQFYVIWPVMIVAVVLLARRLGRSPRALLGPALLLVAVPSFLWSVVETGRSPESAFFVTTTRLWELAVGAGLALALPHIRRLPARIGAGLVLLGLVAIAASALFLDSSAAWPGHLAAVPVLGTAAVIAGGEVARGARVMALLSNKLMVWVGGLSYSLYLWHWPLLVAATAYWDGNLGVKRGLLVVLVSVVPAWLSLVLVENPVRFAERLRSTSLALSVGANFTVIGVLAGLALVLLVPSPQQGTSGAPVLGARILQEQPELAGELSTVDTAARIVPSPETATSDIPVSYKDGCAQKESKPEVIACEYGDVTSDKVIVLVGDSKAQQWHSVLETIARDHSWKLVLMTKSACAFTDATLVSKGTVYSTCSEWNDEAEKDIIAMHPDVVVTSQVASRSLVDPGDPDGEVSSDLMIEGVRSHWQDLADAEIPVIALLNNPSPPESVYECVAEHVDRLSACAFPGETSSSATVQRAAAELVEGTTILDLNDVICPGGMCPAVMGDVLVYRQGSHLTKTFVDSTESVLEPRLAEALEEAAPDTGW